MTTTTLIIVFVIVVAWFLGPWPVIQIGFTFLRLAVQLVMAFIKWRI